MPAVFDRATVQRLVDHIEDGQNAVVLKIGYFARRTKGPFPAEQGYPLLNAAAESAAVGTKRWILLEAVRGFAGLRLSPGDAIDAVQAYHALFQGIGHGPIASEDAPLLQRAIYEFVASIPGATRYRSLGDTATADQALEDAVACYVQLLKQREPGPYRIPWSAAVQAFWNNRQAAGPAIAALNNPKFPKSEALFRLAVELVAPWDAKQAVEYLEQSKPGLGSSRADITTYYTERVNLLVAQKELPEAISAQQKLVALNGSGSAGLAFLYEQAGDKKSMNTVLDDLTKPSASGVDMVDAAEGLYERYMRSPHDFPDYAERATAILQAYLARNPREHVEQELRARLILAHIDSAGGDPTGASAVLKAEKARPPFKTVTARMEYEAVQGLLAGAHSGQQAVPGRETHP
jgi:tetratricopeptide (TPR) repeat protein